MRLGYHASHEQFPPEELLDLVVAAERAGFRDAMCSDHIAPFQPEQGHSGHAWTWLGAAMNATRMSFGTVSAPGQRYHPAVLAQAAGTLAGMHPERFWLALGSGEAVNEHVTGEPWPPKEARNRRLLASHDVMRALLRGETVDHDGDGIRVDRARLWSPPRVPPPLSCAALSAGTAEWAAEWAQGLITVDQPHLEEVVRAYRSHGGAGPVRVQAQVSWHPDGDEARRAAHREWRFCAIGAELIEDLETPEEFVRAARDVRPEEVCRQVVVVDDVRALADRVEAWTELGVDAAYLHNVGRNQRAFIEAAGRELLPTVGVAARG